MSPLLRLLSILSTDQKIQNVHVEMKTEIKAMFVTTEGLMSAYCGIKG